MKKLPLFVCILFCFMLSSCKKNEEVMESVEFDGSHPFAISPDVKWAVITEPYVGFRTEDRRDAPSSSYCRKGEIFPVTGYSINEEKEGWYLFEQGWIPSSSVKIYQNRYKAESAVKNDSDLNIK